MMAFGPNTVASCATPALLVFQTVYAFLWWFLATEDSPQERETANWIAHFPLISPSMVV
jgi:hypothetical protein